MDISLQFIGFLATIFSIVTLIPQIIRVIRLKKVRHVSVFSCIIAVIASILWCIYATLIGAHALLISQAFTLITKLWLLGLKIYYTPGSKPWHWYILK